MIELSTSIYEKDAIVNASYVFADRAYIIAKHQGGDVIRVSFLKKDSINVDFEKIAKEFCMEVIDQQIRLTTEREYKDIRNEIVKKAFSPIQDK